MEQNSSSHSFDEAVLSELDYVYERAALAQPIADSERSGGSVDDPFEALLPTPRERFNKLRDSGVRSARAMALHEELPPLNGLSLSGGGIRSASFGLGVIEALSELGVLNQFHYVSSVSGGGYAASWLAAWSYREPDGVIGVQRTLREAATSASPPTQVRYLSRYVTYLAPRTGALSADLWSLISAYLRNLVITLGTTLPSLACIVAIPLLLVLWSAAWRGESLAATLSLQACLGTLVLSSFAVRVLSEASSTMDALRNAARARMLSWIHPAAGGMAFAIFASASDWRQWSADFLALHGHPFNLTAFIILVAASFAPAIQHVRDQMARSAAARWRDTAWVGLRALFARLRHAGATLFAVAVAGVALATSALVIQWIAAQLIGVADLLPLMCVALGPLAWCVATMLGEFAYQAIVNRHLDDGDREWIARFTGLSLTYAVIWFLLCAITLLVPALSWATSHWWVVIAMGGALAALRYFLPQFLLPVVVGLATMATLYVVGLTLLSPIAPALLRGPADDMSAHLVNIASIGTLVWGGLCVAAALLILAPNINRFSMHALYRDRLVRTFLGASRDRDRSESDRGIPEGQEKQFAKRDASPFHDFDPNDNPLLCWLKSSPDWRPNHWMPVFILNAALNRTWQSMEPGRVSKAHSFSFTPFSCGSAPTNYCTTADYIAKEGGLTLGTAMATSGAALSSRSGRYDSRMLSFFLTLMNLRLGTWLGNPDNNDTRGRAGPASSVLTLLSELLGGRGASQDWVHLSDGGHFENLGTYELLRRGCSKIVAIDSSADPDRTFEDLANLIRLARDELNISIERYTDMRIGNREQSGGTYATLFSINYPEGAPGRLLYIKPCYYRNTSIPVPMEIQSYAKKVPAFPHEPTVDQFFSAEQFDAYRRLGQHQMKTVFAGSAKPGSALREFFTVAYANIETRRETPKRGLAPELDLDGV